MNTIKRFLALFFVGISTAAAQSHLPPHTVVDRTDRVQIESNDQNLTNDQCSALIDFYAESKVNVGVWKPATNWPNSSKRLFCFINFEVEEIAFNDFRLPRIAIRAGIQDGFYGAIFRGITMSQKMRSVVSIHKRETPVLERSPGWEDTAFIEDMTEDGVDVILMVGENMNRALPAVAEALKRGVKFVCYSECERYPEIEGLGQIMIGTNQWKFGFDMGKAVVDHARQKNTNSKIGILTCTKSIICRERMEGFRSAIEGSGNTVVAEAVSNSANTEGAVKLLQDNPSIDILWTDYAPNTLAAVTAVEQTGRSGKTVVFGSNLTSKILSLLQENTVLKAVAFQDPYKMGETVLDVATRIATNEAQENRTIHHPHIIIDGDHPLVALEGVNLDAVRIP